MKKRRTLFLVLILFLVSSPLLISARNKITSPEEYFGFQIGADYHLVNYSQLLSYWKKLEHESERMALEEIGRTAEGRPMVMAIISSPKNQRKLSWYKEISRKLALAEGLTDSQARSMAKEGKAVVWIDGGLHGSEVLGAQQLIELSYQMTSGNDEETLRLLDDVILLVCCSNPDGMELVSNWYMREKTPEKRTLRGLPCLYHKYIGHDNNRDFYMSTQPETEAINRVLYREWFPQIVYNQHQSGPSGTVLFAPPFRNPFNYCFDPLVPLGIELVGAAMHNRFVSEGKPGATMREGAGYSTWWNGGLRTTAYFHNMIGILTETIGSPTPIDIPFLPSRQLPNNDLPFPVAPQKWHFRKSVEYSITADKAVLDVASRHREDFLYNIYRMGKNSIERGSGDHWTITPARISAVEEAIKKDKAKMVGRGRSRGYPLKYYQMLHSPAWRDPRGYIIPSDQPDFLTAVKFVNTLIKNGITVYEAKREFEIGGKLYPRGSFIVNCAQAFRPHVLSMFEPQNYPDVLLYPGGPPRPTYDLAGWTLAFQMGIKFDRILEGFNGPFEKVEGFAQAPPGKISGVKNAVGFLLSHEFNDAFVAINQFLKKGKNVFWIASSFEFEGRTYPQGTIYIPSSSSTNQLLEKLAREKGLIFTGINSVPAVEAFRLKPVRVGLWDRYGGSISSGWLRWLLEQFEFPFEVVYAPTLDSGKIEDRFDVLIFPSGAVPSLRGGTGRFSFSSSLPNPEDVPEKYRDRLGRVTAEKTIPKILDFLRKGKTVLAIGSSTSLAFHARLPLKNALIEKLQDGTERRLPREKFFIPGSILEVKVDSSNPLAYGMPEKADITFYYSPVFELMPEAGLKGVNPVAWFDSKKPLRSGWVWGEHYLEQKVAIIEAEVGKGKLFLYGPEVYFRGQAHGTFKFLFNGIYYGIAEKTELK